jgi:hypothetical protein
MNESDGGSATVTFDLDVLLTLLPAQEGDVPVLFLDDPARTPAPDVDGEPVTALLAVCLRTGLGLVTNTADLMIPLAPGWRAALDDRGTLTLRTPRDSTDAPFCQVRRVDAPPGWRDAAERLGYIVLFAGSIAMARHAGTADRQLKAAAAEGMLAAGAINYGTT